MLSVLKSIPVVQEVHHDSMALPAEAAAYPHDTVTLGWEERQKVRGLRRSDAGLEFATTLPRGTIMRAGDCLLFHNPPLVIRVIERPEPVYVLRPRTAPEWALFAYHIGNSHQPVMLDEQGLVCPDVPGVEEMLLHHGIPFVKDLRPFTPVRRIADHRHQLLR